jgi:hypothetical protein
MGPSCCGTYKSAVTQLTTPDYCYRTGAGGAPAKVADRARNLST